MQQAGNKRQFERYAVNAMASGSIGEEPFEGHVCDISVGGAAVIAPETICHNDQFVVLHMQGIGERRGTVRRQIPGGFAMQFESPDLDAEEQSTKDKAVADFRSLGIRGHRA